MTMELLRSGIGPLRRSFRTLAGVVPVAAPRMTRGLHIHEGDSLKLLQQYKVKCSNAYVVNSVSEVAGAVEKLGDDRDYIVKAQVLAGGRGNGHFMENNFQGGVHVCSTVSEVQKVVGNMLGKTLVTKQTGEKGKPCESVLICERFYIRSEKYVGIVMDRDSNGPLLVGSKMGGTSIEEIAASNPEAIFKLPLKYDGEPDEAKLEKFAENLGFHTEAQIAQAKQNIKGLFKLFRDKDCTLIEINPFALTSNNEVLACDVKINIDDNAYFRQAEMFALRDQNQEDARERVAARFDLNYVGLGGNIGLMVNGAGLAMATMDIIKLHGGSPANFLDVGGGANKTQVVEAFRILQNDNKVQAIMVNIFGGIMRCDIIGLGIIHASQQVGLTKPLVVRLAGTNQEQAKELLDSSGIRIMFCSDFDDAAKKAVKMAEIIELAKKGDLDVSFAM